jgi:AcrR family transcriptional regulator
MSSTSRASLLRKPPIAKGGARAPAADLGLREAGKLERMRRIKRAAKEIFVRDGYDGATTRDIAARAGVSIGTIFVYANDKRDLLYLVFNDELDPLSEAAWAAVPSKGSTLDRLCILLRPWYEYFASDLALGRCAFLEMGAYQHHGNFKGMQGHRFRLRLERIENWITTIVEQGRARGDISFSEPPALIGHIVFVIYLAAIRQWIYGDAPNAIEGAKELRIQLSTVISRLRPAPSASRRR